METAPRPVSVTPEQVTEFLRKGAEPETVKRLLVATGAWSESGAEEIVSTLATQPADGMQGAIGDVGWQGPPDDVPPLFAT